MPTNAELAKARLADIVAACAKLQNASDEVMNRDGVYLSLNEADDYMQDALQTAGLADID